MILKFDDVKKITRGAVSISENDDGYVFDKCTERQIDAWYAYSEPLGMRARTTSGIRLDFVTNSKKFGFTVATGGKFELRINGILRDKVTEIGKKVYTLCDVRGAALKKCRVTLIFPSHSIGKIKDVELDDGASFEPLTYSKRLLFIGDSITQGWNSEFDSLSYAWRVTDYFDADSVINGIGGAFFSVSTFDKPDFDPDAVIVAYGTNDFTRGNTIPEKEEQVRGYLDLIKEAYADKKVIVISPIWRGDANGNNMRDEFHTFRLTIENEAQKRGFYAISGLSLVPPMPSFYADTYLHPNDVGFSLFAENLIEQIKNII